MYRRLLVLAIAAGCALAASNAVAAPERVRGTIAGVSGDTLTVDTVAGQIVPVTAGRSPLRVLSADPQWILLPCRYRHRDRHD